MEVLAAAFTIATEIHMREETAKKMPVCLRAVTIHNLAG